MVAALVACFTAGQVGAAPAPAGVQSLDEIRKTAERYVRERVKPGPGTTDVRAGALDARLRLADCASPLEAFAPPGARLSGNATIGIRCKGPKPWKIYVPVRTSVVAAVLVATRQLSAGETLDASAVRLEPRDLGTLRHGYLSDPGAVSGMVLRRAVPAGKALPPTAIRAAHAIRRGQSVTLLAAQGGINIRMAGRAMTDGARGQRIAVRNLSSGRVVEGLVRSAEQVEILLR